LNIPSCNNTINSLQFLPVVGFCWGHHQTVHRWELKTCNKRNLVSFSLWRPSFSSSRQIQLGFVVDKLTLERVSYQVLQFFHVPVIPYTYTHLFFVSLYNLSNRECSLVRTLKMHLENGNTIKICNMVLGGLKNICTEWVFTCFFTIKQTISTSCLVCLKFIFIILFYFTHCIFLIF